MELLITTQYPLRNGFNLELHLMSNQHSRATQSLISAPLEHLIYDYKVIDFLLAIGLIAHFDKTTSHAIYVSSYDDVCLYEKSFGALAGDTCMRCKQWVAGS